MAKGREEEREPVEVSSGGTHPEKRAAEMSRREARAHRILDAAATLILRWGYQKTTLDDVSRQAGVAKATIYLHWKTREDLFAALIRREKLALAEDLKQSLANDPEGATLRGLFKHSALVLMQRPLLKAVLLRDMDVLGKLASSERSSAAHEERLLGFKTYLELLREHGLVRSDLDLRAQVYILSAVFTGFFLVAPLMPEEFMLPDEELAELLAETVHRTLEPAHGFPRDDVQMASRAFTRYMDRSMASAREQFQQEMEP
ncbi:MAG TPA: helix-turn-helix domain-containing protein [Ktedonosporobacter sp.]|nr:helix-turn-helix domain-containing protein [Ktedonosporobacter sp.]